VAEWLWWVGVGAAGAVAAAGIALGLFLIWALHRYLGVIVRIFEEKPLFVVPRGEPPSDAEEVEFRTADGLLLRGSYVRARYGQRRGLVLFGHEFGSNRWSYRHYVAHLLDNGFDIFAFDFRNHGDSDGEKEYEPLQWVTDREVQDLQAALAYVKTRPDYPAQGVGFFGVSRSGGAGICVAARDPAIRCLVTDGAFATCTTMIPYMRKWVRIYSDRLRLQHWLPEWVYRLVAMIAVRHIGRQRGCRFPSVRLALRKIAPRPILMIHGQADTYIKPEMAASLFAYARPPKELWLVPGAKHNLAWHVAPQEYQRRTLEFFEKHLASVSPGTPSPAWMARRLRQRAMRV